MNEYPGRLALCHVDAYRLRESKELLALGFDEMMTPDSAVVVEWADRVRSAMPDDTLWINLAVTGETSRSFTLRPTGVVSNRCLLDLSRAYPKSL